MTDLQWKELLSVIHGENRVPPVGFIIDSPWLPRWVGMSMLDYFSSDERWLSAHLKASRTFPKAMFLPGFWSEYGMCTEPSAFGARCLFPEDEFPFAEPIVRNADDIDRLPDPDPRKDGLLPFVIARLRHNLPRIEEAGHAVRFAVARGPLNIASFLTGSTELLIMMKEDAAAVRRLLQKITAFLERWLDYQRQCFPTIDGILLLDDIIGFVSEEDFLAFGKPYFRKLFNSFAASVRFLHNDAPCRASAPHLADMGVNLYNMGVDTPIAELRGLTGDTVTLLGNIPPRDVLAGGTAEHVSTAVTDLLESLPDSRRLIVSCAGGMPPGVSTENINTFIHAVENFYAQKNDSHD